MSNYSSSGRNSLFNARIADSSAKPSALIKTDLPSSSSLFVNTGSVDPNLPEYAGCIANLVQEIFGEFPALVSPSANSLFLISPLDSARVDTCREGPGSYSGDSSSASSKQHENGDEEDEEFDDDARVLDLLDALGKVARVVSKLPVPRPPSLSPMEWRHALDSPEGGHPPWEDIYDLDENTMAIRSIRSSSHWYEEPGYASGSSLPSPLLSTQCDSATRNPKHLQIVTNTRLTPTIPSMTHSPLSPRDISLPQTPVDFDTMPTSYDASSASQSSRSRFRTGSGFKERILRQKRSAPSSPVSTTFTATNDLVEKEVNGNVNVNGGVKRSDLRRLKSLLFREAVVDETGSEVLSFLDI